MATEKKIEQFVSEIGYEPLQGKSIIVKYAPQNLSDAIFRFFSTEYYALVLCKNEIVLLPFSCLSNLQKEVVLEIPYSKIKEVATQNILLNNQISITTDTDIINLTVQQKELSDFRTSGIYASEFKGLLSYKNWHKENFDATLNALRDLNKNG